MKKALAVSLASVCLFLEGGCSDMQTRASTTVPVAAAPAAPAKIDAAARFAGYWAGEGMGGHVEGVWMPPRDGVMLGSFRHTKPGDANGGRYEMFSIEESGGSLHFVARQFRPDWAPVGDKASRKKLTSLSESELVFGPIAMKGGGSADELVLEVAMRGRGAEPARTEVVRLRRQVL